MSTSNGSTVVHIDQVIQRAKEGAKIKAKDTERAAEDSVLQQEKEVLQERIEELERLLASSTIVSEDPKTAKLIEQVFEALGDLLFLPNGDLVDLNAMRCQIEKVRNGELIEKANVADGKLASPPTSPMSPPADSSESSGIGHESRARHRFRHRVNELLHPEVSQSTPSSS